MSTTAIIGLITQYGIPGARAIYNIVKTWEGKKEITDKDWDELEATNARPLGFYEQEPSKR